MYTVKKVAERLQVSIGTIYAAIADGRLRCYRLGRGRGAIRISEEAIQGFLASSEREQTPRLTATPRSQHLRL